MSVFGNDKAFQILSDRVRDLADHVRSLQSAQKHLELEWEELYDKVRRQMARMSKRYAVDAKENQPELDPEVNPELPEGPDPISARIHAMRNRGRYQG